MLTGKGFWAEKNKKCPLTIVISTDTYALAAGPPRHNSKQPKNRNKTEQYNKPL